MTEPSASTSKDFFISFARADQAWAEWIAWRLEEAGYSVIVEGWDFRPGSNFVLEMQRAAIEADRTIAVLSPDFLQSSFAKPEWAAAFAVDPTGADGKLLPVRVRECKPPGLLKPVVYIDLVGLDGEAATRKLIEGVKRERPKPLQPPKFPATPRPFPDTLSALWSVPYPRNRAFTGREEVLTGLRTRLQSGQPAAVTQAIAGLGGIGKTQLALEYAYRFASDYRIVWWIRADSPATRLNDIADLGRTIDPQLQAQGVEDAVKGTLEWLGRNRDWLLIFDNVEEPDHIRSLIPPAATGHVIITSRFAIWSDVAETLPLDVWSTQQAADFLMRRTRQDDADAARNVAELLGGLPLAMEQAAAYIEQRQLATKAYADLFSRYKAKMFGRRRQDTGATVVTVWKISLERAQDESPAALALLQLCAFLPPDRIPRHLLTKRPQLLPAPLRKLENYELAIEDALATLVRYSLVQATPEFVSVHRLVQLVVRDQLKDRAYRELSEAATRLQAEDDAGSPVLAFDHDRLASPWYRRINRPVLAGLLLLLAIAIAVPIVIWRISLSAPPPSTPPSRPAVTREALLKILPGLRLEAIAPYDIEPGDRIVVVDPGHGGSQTVGGSASNNATSSSGVLEKDLALELALMIERSVNSAATASRPVHVVLTRRNDINLGLGERAAIALKMNAVAFLSLHFNAFDETQRGVDAFVAPKADTAFCAEIENRVHGVLKRHDPTATNRGVKEMRSGLLLRLGQSIPSCHLEVEFIDNPSIDRLLITGPKAFDIRNELATSIGRALINLASVTEG